MTWHLLLAVLLPGCGAAATDTPPPSSCRTASLLQTGQWTARQDAEPESHVAQRRRLGHQLRQNPPPPDGEILAYAEDYHRRLSQSSVTLLQHVSKCAGTMLCEAGRANGCKTAKNNCHLDPLDAPLWTLENATLDAATPDTLCQSLKARYEAEHVRFEGNERFVPTGGPCQGFWNVVVMRDPIKRIVSHLSMLSHWHADHPPVNFKASPVWQHGSLADMLVEKHRILNNFFIRSVLGRGVYMLPFGSINSSHLDEAADILQRFDVLLIMDETKRAFLKEGLRMALGFDMPREEELTTNKLRDHQDSDAYAESLHWTNADWEELRAANALDLELWEHAKALNRIDNLVFRHPLFAQVSGTMPRGPCGYLAK